MVVHAEDQTALIRMVRQDCGSCHGMTLKGGLGTPLTAQALSEKPVENLAATILYGRPGTAMPAWKTVLSEAEAQWIASHLLEGFPEERR
jgi:cytochrome c55X